MIINKIEKILADNYPNVEILHDNVTKLLTFKNIKIQKRFGMGYAWDLCINLSGEKNIVKTYICRTFSYSSNSYEKVLEPPSDVKKIGEEILNLLNFDIICDSKK